MRNAQVDERAIDFYEFMTACVRDMGKTILANKEED